MINRVSIREVAPAQAARTSFIPTDLVWQLNLDQIEAPSLAHFVRKLVGMDRATAVKAFASFMQGKQLTPPQSRFVELIIDQLTAQGTVPPEALYEPPFTGIHHNGPEGVFRNNDNTINGLFDALEQTQRALREAT